MPINPKFNKPAWLAQIGQPQQSVKTPTPARAVWCQSGFSDKTKIIASIIIPAKNEEKNLLLCLKSLFLQDFRRESIEIIVVDNNSSDNTIEVAKKYGVKVVTRKGGTIASLRNYGVNISNGKYLCFLDSDCLVHHNWLKNGIKLLSNCKDIVAVGSPESCKFDTSSWVERVWCVILNSRHSNEKWSQVSWCSTQAMIIKRSIFLEVGGFNEELVTCEDTDLSYRIRDYGMIVTDNTVPHYHLRGSTTLKEFFFRELWRGRGNIRGVYSHGLTVAELPSILGPVLFGVSMVAFVIMSILALSTGKVLYVLYSVLFLLNIIVLPMLMVFKKIGSPLLCKNKLVFKAFLLCLVYFIARSCAIVFPSDRTW